MDSTHERYAALNINEKTVTACLQATSYGGTVDKTRTFPTKLPDLLAMTDWLRAWSATVIVVGGADGCRQPVCALLAGEFDVRPVDAPGKEGDGAEHLVAWLTHDLLPAGAAPPRPQPDICDLTRYRVSLLQAQERAVARVREVWQCAGLELAPEVREVTAVSGRQLLAAILGQDADASMGADLAQLEAALPATVTGHHRFMLSQQLAHVHFLTGQIAQVNREIGRCLGRMEQLPDALAETVTPTKQVSNGPTKKTRRFSWSNVLGY